MKKNLLLLAALSFLFLAYCKKKTEDPPVEVYNNFQPIAGGAVWTYGEFPGGTLYSITCTGYDSTFNKMKYKEMTSTKTGLYWFRKDAAGNYFHLFDESGKKHEYCYMIDFAPVGSNWVVLDTLGGYPTTHQFMITSTDQDKLIYGTWYKHVTGVLENTLVDFGTGSDSLVSSYSYFYAHNVGLIYVDQGLNSKIYLASTNIH